MRGKEFDPKKAYDEKAAIAEGWVISSADSGLQLQRIDDPKAWGLDAEEPAFGSDQAAWEHVIANAWRGSANHNKAIEAIRTFAPEEYDRIGMNRLVDASVSYRTGEQNRYREIEAEMRERCKNDPDLKSSCETAYAAIMSDLDERHVRSTVSLKVFDAHHANEVARQCLMIAAHDTGDADAALEHTRRRMILTATPTEFFGEAPEAEPSEEARP